MGSIFSFRKLQNLPDKPKKKKKPSEAVCLSHDKQFGPGSLCIYEALMLQHAAVPYIILSNVCAVHVYLNAPF